MSERTNADVVQQGYEAFGRGDIPALLDLLSSRRWPSPTSSPSRPSKRKSTSASRTTRKTAFRRSPRLRSSCPASSTSSCRHASVDRSPRESRTRASKSCPGRHTSPSRRSRTSGTPASRPSGARSRRGAEARSGDRRVGGREGDWFTPRKVGV
jgi:ketosteroid isomerase-like protein